MQNTILSDCDLFAGLCDPDISLMLQCLSASTKAFHKAEFIFQALERPEVVGIVLSGSVHVVKEDFWGNRTILSHVPASGMFGEAYACAGAEQLPVSVLAAENCEILFINYRKIISICSSACGYHLHLIKNMLRILAQKNIMLTQRMGFTDNRNIRNKILSYLSVLAVNQGSNTVRLPFNRQELADYLAVDRSALSRELGKMQDDGLILFYKNQFTLLG